MHHPPLSVKQFRELLAQYPDGAELAFITYHDAWDASVDISWEQDPATDYTTDLPGTNKVWIRCD